LGRGGVREEDCDDGKGDAHRDRVSTTGSGGLVSMKAFCRHAETLPWINGSPR
jgi:hypothetical protein